MKNTRKIIIYLVGVSCVGKSTIGKLLADRIGFSFYDFDDEIEKYFGKPKEYILDDYMFPYDFREYTRIVLHDLFNKKENAIIAGSPSGLRDVYLREYKKSRKESGNIFISIHISDKPENILERITFYDKESKLMDVRLSEREKRLYFKEIKKDITFFKKFNSRADHEFNVDGLTLDEIPEKFIYLLLKENEEIKDNMKIKAVNCSKSIE
jgi:shikimate kinase